MLLRSQIAEVEVGGLPPLDGVGEQQFGEASRGAAVDGGAPAVRYRAAGAVLVAAAKVLPAHEEAGGGLGFEVGLRHHHKIAQLGDGVGT